MTRESLRCVLKSDLHLYAYKIQVKRQLTDADKEKRETMCEWFCNVLENDENFLENVWFSDEVHFLLFGHVNSKNNVFWVRRLQTKCFRGRFIPLNVLPGGHKQARDHRALLVQR